LFISLFISLFLRLFLCQQHYEKTAGLYTFPENFMQIGPGWTDLHEIFREGVE